jgi:hypothetical protein
VPKSPPFKMSNNPILEKNKISNGSIQDENGVYITTFLLKDIYKEHYSDLLNSLFLTRKRLGTKRSKTNTLKIKPLKSKINNSLKLQKDASLAKRMQQINANYQMAKAMQ